MTMMLAIIIGAITFAAVVSLFLGKWETCRAQVRRWAYIVHLAIIPAGFTGFTIVRWGDLRWLTIVAFVLVTISSYWRYFPRLRQASREVGEERAARKFIEILHAGVFGPATQHCTQQTARQVAALPPGTKSSPHA